MSSDNIPETGPVSPSTVPLPSAPPPASVKTAAKKKENGDVKVMSVANPTPEQQQLQQQAQQYYHQQQLYYQQQVQSLLCSLQSLITINLNSFTVQLIRSCYGLYNTLCIDTLALVLHLIGCSMFLSIHLIEETLILESINCEPCNLNVCTGKSEKLTVVCDKVNIKIRQVFEV